MNEQNVLKKYAKYFTGFNEREATIISLAYQEKGATWQPKKKQQFLTHGLLYIYWVESRS